MNHSTGVTDTSEQGGGRAQTEGERAAVVQRRTRSAALGLARPALGPPATRFHEQQN